MTKLEKYLYQLRRIEEHRTAATEREIRKIYKGLLKEINSYLAEIYISYSEDDMLDYSALARAGMDARFMEEVEQRISGITPSVATEIQETVQQTYEACYDGMRNAVVKAAGNRELLQKAFASVSAVTPDVIRAAVNNPVSGLTLKDTLEKHRKEIIYDIKRNIGVGLTNGDRYSTMAKRIAESLDGDYKKSIRIVRTETHRVRESGFNDAATAINSTLKQGSSGYVMAKTWHTMQDERVRPNTVYKTKAGWKKGKKSKYNHEKMDGVTIPQDDLFVLPSGATCMCPSQTGVAGEDINCRCYVSYDLVLASELTKVKDGTKTIEEAAAVEPVENFADSIRNAKTTQEVNGIATQYFRSKEGCKIENIDFSGVDLQASKDMALKLDDLDNRFKSSATSIRAANISDAIGGKCEPDMQSFNKYMDSNDPDDLISKITLNKKFLSSEKAIIADFNQSNRPRGVMGVAQNAMVNEKYANIATLVHEYGHSILAGKLNELHVNTGGTNNTFLTARRMYRQYMDKLRALQRDIQNAREKFAGQPNGLMLGIENAKELQAQYDAMCISMYSKESVGEFIAECFCDAELSDNPKEYSIKIHDLLVKAYGKG